MHFLSGAHGTQSLCIAVLQHIALVPRLLPECGQLRLVRARAPQSRMAPLGVVVFCTVMATAAASLVVEVRGPLCEHLAGCHGNSSSAMQLMASWLPGS